MSGEQQKKTIRHQNHSMHRFQEPKGHPPKCMNNNQDPHAGQP